MKKLVILAMFLFSICYAEITEIAYVKTGDLKHILPTWMQPQDVPDYLFVHVLSDSKKTAAFNITVNFNLDGVERSWIKAVNRQQFGWTTVLFQLSHLAKIKQITVVELEAVGSRKFEIGEK